MGSGGGSVGSREDHSWFYFLGQGSGQKQKQIQLLETWFLDFRLLINAGGWGSRDGKIGMRKAMSGMVHLLANSDLLQADQRNL